MAKYIVLLSWTIRASRTSRSPPSALTRRASSPRRWGFDRRDVFDDGAYDLVVVVDAPTMKRWQKFNLTLGSGGNVRTTTLKAFAEDAYRKIVASLWEAAAENPTGTGEEPRNR